jgi:hypothetical protein
MLQIEVEVRGVLGPKSSAFHRRPIIVDGLLGWQAHGAADSPAAIERARPEEYAETDAPIFSRAK